MLRRYLSIGLLAGVSAGIAAVSASGVVVLHPATMSVSLSLSTAENNAVTSVTSEVYPAAGGQSTYRTVSAQGIVPFVVDLTVDGGAPEDPGVSYRPSVYASFQYAPNMSSNLRIQRQTAVEVDNTATAPSVTVPVSFNYTTHRANASISVTGGSITSYQLNASASNNAANEYYSAYTYGGLSPATSVASWVPMVAHGVVNVSATVYLVDGSGASSQRSLPSQTVDLSAGDASVSWSVDLTTTSSLEGTITHTLPPGSAVHAYDYVYYSGASPSNSGVYGSRYVGSGSSTYSINLPPGDYDVHLQSYFNNPSQYISSPTTRVTVSGTTIKDFDTSFGVGRHTLDVSGFFGLSDIDSSGSQLRAPDYSRYAYNYQRTGAGWDHTLPVGSWQPYYTYLQIYDSSDPDLVINNTIYRYHYNDPDMPLTNVTASGVASLGTESVKLVKSNVYFDVVEPEGHVGDILISNPEVQASRYDYNTSDNSLRRYINMYSYGSSTPSKLAGLTMVAEPGVYTINARARVNQTMTRFNASSITFGEPVATPVGSNVVVDVTPPGSTGLGVTLKFNSVHAAGLSTVVEDAARSGAARGLPRGLHRCRRRADLRSDLLRHPDHGAVHGHRPGVRSQGVPWRVRERAGLPEAVPLRRVRRGLGGAAGSADVQLRG